MSVCIHVHFFVLANFFKTAKICHKCMLDFVHKTSFESHQWKSSQKSSTDCWFYCVTSATLGIIADFSDHQGLNLRDTHFRTITISMASKDTSSIPCKFGASCKNKADGSLLPLVYLFADCHIGFFL